MQHFMGRCLLVQLLSVYLLFVVVVLLGGVEVNAMVEQKLRNDAQASDQALAQEIALETSLHLRDAENALVALSKFAVQAGTSDAMRSIFHTFQASRSDVDQVYCLDPLVVLHASSPPATVWLQAVLDTLPGADQALHGQVASRQGLGPDGQDWLFSAVPVPAAGWAVVVQRPVSEALAVVTQFHLWLLAAALLFAIGGLLFWLMLLGRVIRPLHTLAIQHQALPVSEQSIPVHATVLAERSDEVGDLARSLVRLERDGLKNLGELRTLLETSNAVVRSLDPHAVVGKIIREARRLVDVQAAAVLLPDEQGVLHVLVSDGHSARYDHVLSLSPENVSSAAVLALRGGRPVQKLVGPDQPTLSSDEGSTSALPIPTISGKHAGC